MIATPLTDVGARGIWREGQRRLLANRVAMTSLLVLALIAAMAVLAPLLSPHHFDAIDYRAVSCAPSWWPWQAHCRTGAAHWLGTDSIGRDLFARILFGARVSLMVGIVATAVSLIIGVAYGAIAGYVGGRTDDVMMRIVDVLNSLPFIFLVILLMVVFHRSILLLFIAIGAVEWLTMARIVRSLTVSIKEMEFIESARAAGLSGAKIITHHVIPNAIGPVIVYMTLTIPNAVLAESFLSFLGLGVQEPLTSWGALIRDGTNQIEAAPWMLIFPAGIMAICLFCFNIFGDALRDALDPKER